MRKAVAGALAVVFTLILVSCAEDKTVQPVEPLASEAFRSFVDDYFQASFEFNPSQATSDGFHEYDAKLEDYSAASFQQRITSLNGMSARLDALRREKLNPDESNESPE